MFSLVSQRAKVSDFTLSGYFPYYLYPIGIRMRQGYKSGQFNACPMYTRYMFGQVYKVQAIGALTSESHAEVWTLVQAIAIIFAQRTSPDHTRVISKVSHENPERTYQVILKIAVGIKPPAPSLWFQPELKYRLGFFCIIMWLCL